MKLYAVQHFVTDEVRFFSYESSVERFLKEDEERGEPSWFRNNDNDIECQGG